MFMGNHSFLLFAKYMCICLKVVALWKKLYPFLLETKSSYEGVDSPTQFFYISLKLAVMSHD